MQNAGTETTSGRVDTRLLETASACCLTMREKACQVSYNGVEVELMSAGRSADITGALLDIGLISLHLGAPGILNTIDLPRCRTTVALLLDYATDISPRMPGAPDLIDGAAVIEKAREMRERFVDPATDPELIRTIGVISQLTIDGEIEMGPTPSYPQEETREQ